MKKIIASLLFCSLMIVSKADDYTYLHFTQQPQDEGYYTAYDTRTATYVTVHICPGAGVVCDVTTTVNGVQYTVHSEKDKNKDAVEVVY